METKKRNQIPSFIKVPEHLEAVKEMLDPDVLTFCAQNPRNGYPVSDPCHHFHIVSESGMVGKVTADTYKADYKADMKTKEIRITTTDGTAVSLLEALSIPAVDETEFPAWLHKMLDDGCFCYIYTAVPTLFRKFARLKPSKINWSTRTCSDKFDAGQIITMHTAWAVFSAYESTHPDDTEVQMNQWMNAHILRSVGIEAQGDELKVYARVERI